MGSAGDVLAGHYRPWKRLATVVILVAAAMVIAPRSASGCTCLQMSEAQAERRSKVVFAGTLADSRRDEAKHTYLFEVDTVIKGDVPQRVLMKNNVDGSGTCGEALSDGKRYLVYGDDVENLKHNLCSPTKVIGNRTIAGAEPEAGGDTLPPESTSRRWLLYAALTLGACAVAYFIWRRFYRDRSRTS